MFSKSYLHGYILYEQIIPGEYKQSRQRLPAQEGFRRWRPNDIIFDIFPVESFVIVRRDIYEKVKNKS